MIVALGLRAARRRLLNPVALVVLPGAFAVASLGATLGRGLAHPDLPLVWILGFLAGAGFGWVGAIGSRVYPEGNGVSVPGSWSVLVVPLLFFALQFWFGYLRATRPGLVDTLPYRLIAPFGGALMTGFFSGRALALFLLYRRARRLAEAPAQTRATP
jgi:hypothetical protein